jgi:3-hydroxy-9,10-secoandrosta-1,3,5(10)-triene-9,17-dione monooxygenase
MAMNIDITHVLPVPEPDLTAAEMIARAAAMRDAIREASDVTEAKGTYSPELHEAFTAAGFYRTLQPRRFGGYEFGLDEFLRLIIEVSRADPATGWNLCLASAHAFQLSAFFSEQAQVEVFGSDGHAVIPSRGIPRGDAVPVDGGYRVSGRWDYGSGSTYSTHFMALVTTPETADPDDPYSNRRLMVVLPRSDYTILDDWGGDSTLGLGGTASNTLVADDVFVPEHMTVPYDWKDYTLTADGTPGYRLHGNPMYLARTLTLFWGELNAIMVGAARAALDEYERMMVERPTSFPPPMPRLDSIDYQRWFGEALAGVDAAEHAILHVAEDYMRRCRRWEETGEPFAVIDDARLRGSAAVAGRLAVEAVDLMFRTGGSTAAKKGSRLQRYFRDVSMFRTHIAGQYEVVNSSTARAYFGGPLTH